MNVVGFPREGFVSGGSYPTRYIHGDCAFPKDQFKFSDFKYADLVGMILARISHINVYIPHCFW